MRDVESYQQLEVYAYHTRALYPTYGAVVFGLRDMDSTGGVRSRKHSSMFGLVTFQTSYFDNSFK